MDYLLTVAVFFMIHLILALSLNLVLGYGGMMSVAQGGLMGIGAYGASLVAINLGVNMFWGFAVGAAVAALVAVLFTYLSQRIEGDGYILASFAFQMVIFEVLLNWTDVTRGSFGLRGIPRPILGELPAGDLYLYSGVVLAITVAVTGFVLYLTHSPFGLAVRGMREGDRAAGSVGKDTQYLKLVLFAISGAIAGLAGGLYGSMVRFIAPQDFAVGMSILALVYVIAGGMGNVWGTVVGVAVLIALPQAIRFLPSIPSNVQGPVQQIIYGLVLMLFVWLRPQGIVPERPIFRVSQFRLPRRGPPRAVGSAPSAAPADPTAPVGVGEPVR